MFNNASRKSLKLGLEQGVLAAAMSRVKDREVFQHEEELSGTNEQLNVLASELS